MSQPVTLTQEEMNRLSSFQDRFNVSTKRYGEIAFQMKLLQNEMKQVETEMDNIEEERLIMMEDLQKKYGAGSIDLVTGEFTPATIDVSEPLPNSSE